MTPIMLTPQQERLWRLAPLTDGGPYRTHIAFRVTGGATAEGVMQAFRDIFAAYPLLCVRLREHPGVAGQMMQTALDVESALESVRIIMSTGGKEVSVICEWPAYVADAHVAQPLAKALLARLNGHPLADSAPFELVAQWKHEMIVAEDTAMARAAWRERISGLRLIMDQTGQTAHLNSTFQPLTVERRMPDRLRAFCDSLDSGAPEDERGAGLLALWSGVAERRLGGGGMPIGIRLTGRSEPELHDMIGPLSVIAPVRLPDIGTRRIKDFVIDARMALFEATAWQDSFCWAVEGQEPSDKTPLFAPLVMVRTPPKVDISDGAYAIDILRAETTEDRFVFRLHDDGDRLALDYDAATISARTALWMLDGLFAHMEDALIAPDRAARAHPVIGKDERNQIRQIADGTPGDVQRHPLDRFRDHVRHAPDRIAVSDTKGQAYSYRVLDQWSDRLAATLAMAGAGPEKGVATCLAPGPAHAAVLLAVLKCGGFLAPLDAHDPQPRLQALLSRINSVALVVDEGAGDDMMALGATSGCRVVTPTTRVPHDTTPSFDPVSSGGLAYVIFTSGSSGQPKCVGVPMDGLSNQIACFVETLALDVTTRMMARTSPGFDASIWEILAPLCAGSTVIFAPDAARQDVRTLARAIKGSAATCLQVVPSLLRLLVQECPDGLDTLETLYCGGEILTPDLAAAATSADTTLVNLYGPAECSIQIAAQKMRAREVTGGNPLACAVGVLLPGAGMTVVARDTDDGPIAMGAPGKIMLRGTCLARGYLGAPAATALAFGPDPYGIDPGGRLYDTGDLGVLDTDGCLTVIGRLDDQIKIRGARVDPAEVATVLRATSGVYDAALLVDRSDASQPCLVAVFVPEQGKEAALSADLAQILARQLPSVLVPARFVAVGEIPRLPSGKVDKQNLARLSGRKPYAAPQTRTELVVAEIWQILLKRDRVGRHDGFFELGGHSILMLRMLGRLRDALGIDVPMQIVHESRSLGDLARRLDDIGDKNKPPAAVAPV